MHRGLEETKGESHKARELSALELEFVLCSGSCESRSSTGKLRPEQGECAGKLRALCVWGRNKSSVCAEQGIKHPVPTRS